MSRDPLINDPERIKNPQEGDIARAYEIGKQIEQSWKRYRWTLCPNCHEGRWVFWQPALHESVVSRLCNRCSSASYETYIIRGGGELTDYPKCRLCGQVSERPVNGRILHTLVKGLCYKCSQSINSKRRRDERKARFGHSEGPNWREVNEKYRLNGIKAHRRLKAQIVEAYGGKCECCGETIPELLTIDHINGNGASERRKRGRGLNEGWDFYAYLRRNGFPKDNYRLLCYNCNIGAYKNGGICPHQTGGKVVVND